MRIGIPRALLYYYFGGLWTEFFDNLNIETVISPPTNREIAKRGIYNSIDESCYPSKIFIGHVEYLLDKCDMIFVPRIESTGMREEYCVRLFGVYDLARNTFPNAKFLHYNVNYLKRKKEKEGFIEVGAELGKSREETEAAYNAALEVFERRREEAAEKQSAVLGSSGLKVLIVSHAYNSFDAMIGGPIVKYFEKCGIKAVFADIADPAEAKDRTSALFGNRIYWKVNSELIGGAELYKPYTDGMVLISAFPCGPDSIVNDLIIGEAKGTPVLMLTVDELDGGAGLATRLESFTDILTARKEDF